MSVHKRTWTNRDGSQGGAWIAAYTDQSGIRRTKQFARKRDADAYHAITVLSDAISKDDDVIRTLAEALADAVVRALTAQSRDGIKTALTNGGK
jgi:hypothetical protein